MEELNLSYCSTLKCLPNSCTALSALRSPQLLILTSCVQLTYLLHGFGSLRSLQQLMLEKCARLMSLPMILASFKTCSSCEVNSPCSFSNLTNIWQLALSVKQFMWSPPASVSSLIQLNDLRMTHCTGLLTLPRWHSASTTTADLQHSSALKT